MIDTTIYVGNIAIHEPVTLLTDYINACFAFYFFWKLRTSTNKTINNWAYFFGIFGISTFLGGSAHGFFAIHEGINYKTVWLGMQIASGLAVYFAQQATLTSALSNSKFSTQWKWSYKIQLIIFIITVLIIQNFIITVIDNALALIPIMILHYINKEEKLGNIKIANGIAVSFLTAIIHTTKFSLHAYFNFNDIAHVFILVSLFLMYRGVKMKSIS